MLRGSGQERECAWWWRWLCVSRLGLDAKAHDLLPRGGELHLNTPPRTFFEFEGRTVGEDFQRTGRYPGRNRKQRPPCLHRKVPHFPNGRCVSTMLLRISAALLLAAVVSVQAVCDCRFAESGCWGQTPGSGVKNDRKGACPVGFALQYAGGCQACEVSGCASCVFGQKQICAKCGVSSTLLVSSPHFRLTAGSPHHSADST
jgi:hypothetical protein